MERRALRFANLTEAVADARQLQKTNYERAGNWSLGEVIDHLNKTLLMAIETPTFKGPPAIIRPLLKWFIYGKMKRGDVIKFRASAPKLLLPDDDKDLEESLAEFERLTSLVESGEAQLLPTHPFFGKFSRDDWLIMQRWHAAHHLSFLIPTAIGNRSRDD